MILALRRAEAFAAARRLSVKPVMIQGDSVCLKWKIHRSHFFACEAVLGLDESFFK